MYYWKKLASKVRGRVTPETATAHAEARLLAEDLSREDQIPFLLLSDVIVSPSVLVLCCATWHMAVSFLLWLAH